MLSASQIESISARSAPKLEDLRALIHSYGSALVAFSGGVDSSLVLKVAADVLGDKAVGLTALSPSVPIE